jgi:hypothetical protein
MVILIMFNVKIYTTFNLLFVVIFFFQNNLQNKPLFFILNFQQIMNNCEFEENVISKNFEIENGVLGLERDIYLSIVQFLDSSNLRKV